MVGLWRLRHSDLMLRDARQITGLADPLRAEVWASDWLGQARLNAPMGEREAEHQLCMEVSVRACATPSPHGLAAVAALARVAPAADIKMLAETIDILSETQPLPPWHAAEPDWTPVAAWRAVDVWDSELVLLVDYDGMGRYFWKSATHPDTSTAWAKSIPVIPWKTYGYVSKAHCLRQDLRFHSTPRHMTSLPVMSYSMHGRIGTGMTTTGRYYVPSSLLAGRSGCADRTIMQAASAST